MAVILLDATGRRVQLDPGQSFWVHNTDGTRTLVTVADPTEIGIVDYVQFNTSYGGPGSHSEGLVYWDQTDHTIAIMPDIAGTVMQVGQEMWVRVYNDTGAQIDNGKVVYVSGVNGGGLPEVSLAQADDIATSRIIGMATEDIGIGAEGFITVIGLVRDIDTNAFNVGDVVYLSATSAGDMVATEPTIPDVGVTVGTVTAKGVADGAVYVGGARNFRVTTSVVFSEYVERNTRNLDEQVFGGFSSVVTAGAVSNGSPLAYTHGLGKLFIVINAGVDIDGTLTVTGTSVDRDTGVETPADSETITIDALTTDNSDVDAQGNTRHAFVGAYITSKWYKGSVTLSTADLDISDLDVYNVAFEQVNDTPEITLQTFNMSFYCTNASAWFYGYLYTVDVNTTTKKVTLARISTIELPLADTAANRRYRLRKGLIDHDMDGRQDGFWVELFFGPAASAYFQDISFQVWFDFVHNLE